MVLGRFDENASGRIRVPIAVMTSERSSQNIVAKSNSFPVDLVGELQEAVVGRAYADDRLSRIEIVDDVLDLFVRQRDHPAEQNQQIGLAEVFQARDVVSHVLVFPMCLHRGVGLAFVVHRKKNGAVKAVPFGKYRGQHRHRLLATVFLIGSDQDDVLAVAGAIGCTLVGQPERALGHGVRSCGVWNCRSDENDRQKTVPDTGCDVLFRLAGHVNLLDCPSEY